MGIKALYSILLTSILFFQAEGQEFLASVRVTAPTLQIADPKILESLESSVKEFMNTQQWTDDEFLPEERINLNLQITVTEDRSSNSFLIDLGVQATRPVYGSSYETPLISHLEKGVPIGFEQFRPIIPTTDNFTDNLSSILSFYAYYILALDYDSFSPFGGEEYYLIAQDIVNAVPPAVADGDRNWADPRNIRTRYYMVENALNPRFKPFRRAMYDYHRKGLDLMHKNVDSALSTITAALESINEVDKAYPNTFLIQIFANTKANEIAEIYQQGQLDVRLKVYSIMTRIDPANSHKYEPIRRG
ncbi:MAG: DUF4835 family protein [Saprospiraceae bacterium]|nr:DUF4835 family protein [Saprospiraceae bacterium]